MGLYPGGVKTGGLKSGILLYVFSKMTQYHCIVVQVENGT